MKINRKAQIDRVIAAQGLTVTEASEQVSGRIYEANMYLKRRTKREPPTQPAFWMWNGRRYYYDHPAADDDFRGHNG